MRPFRSTQACHQRCSWTAVCSPPSPPTTSYQSHLSATCSPSWTSARRTTTACLRSAHAVALSQTPSWCVAVAARRVAARRGAVLHRAPKTNPNPRGAALLRSYPPRSQVTFPVHADNVTAIINFPNQVGFIDEALSAQFPDCSLGSKQPGLLVRWVSPLFSNPQAQSPYRDVVRDMGDTMICASKNMLLDILGGAGEDLLEDSSALSAPPPRPTSTNRRSARLLSAAEAATPWWSVFATSADN